MLRDYHENRAGISSLGLKGEAELPTVLLIGDSIRLGYCEAVKGMLSDRINVIYPSDNCRYSQYILAFEWMDGLKVPENVKLVHWNCGQWDAAHFDGVSPLNDITVYRENVKRIHNMLRRRFPMAEIVFATTTPMNPSGLQGINRRTTEEIRRYNEAAVRALSELGGRVNDLFALMEDKNESYYVDHCHFTEKGFMLLANQVADFIDKSIPK